MTVEGCIDTEEGKATLASPRRFSPLTAAMLACLLAAACAHGSKPAASSAKVVLEGARVFDGEILSGPSTVVLEGDLIRAVGPRGSVEIPKGARVVDYTGKTLLPGLIVAHAHVGHTSGTEMGRSFYTRELVAQQLTRYQAYGVVAVNALGMNPPLFYTLRRELNGHTAGADLYGAGPGIGAPQGAPPQMQVAEDQVSRPRTAEEARAVVRDMAEQGVDMVKLWVDSMGGKVPKLAPALYRAAIDEAHRNGVKVAAHIHDLEDAKALVEAGVDVIAHGVRDQRVDDAFIQAMKDREVWYIPTIQLDEANYIYAEHPAWMNEPFFRAAVEPTLQQHFEDLTWQRETLASPEAAKARKAVAINQENLLLLHQAGVKIGFGTDSGALPQRIPGFAEHRELELMVQAGLTPAQALRVATSGSAELLGLKDRGRVAPGMVADLVVLEVDPTQDIRNTRSIHALWRRGVEVR
ncbi:amidohydrolase family protein [Stigmatella aurantiaca]|uniref:M38 (Beta-aspartyl dipeptidase) family protein n=1 Tax=Stigmatella aurantiaca (strain DW4/3-1) TaxID=378806 RepID=Q099Y1_STIAD|nr:amidohydrolase family protein [Stigmatella aurantiaca]ADO73057.1 M38 (Beta-aspartyl dipeptidase) family protein [Stigmatella aurantiaca DW4/3-1]EAU68518.1 organophopsphate acid anhydrase [Stigmatella aurantiaca DW4/3-1]